MKSLAKLTPRHAFGLCGLGGMVWLGAAEAQSVTPAQPASWSATHLPGTSQYQDSYIGGGSLPPDVSKGYAESNDVSGLARSLQIDGVVSTLSSRESGSSTHVQENGIVAKSQWETVAYGTWSLDASARTGGSGLGPAEQGQGGVVTLRERGMPFDGDWQADNALGDINTPDINLARLQPRFYLPTSPMQGLITEWRGPQGLQVVAGGGVPGFFDGIEVPDFRTLDGSTATAGAQWSPASHWTVGGQIIEAHGVNPSLGPVVDGAALITSNTELLTAAWTDHGERLQFNLLDGDVSGKANALGGWIDGSITEGRIQQNAGVFRIDPNMMWGNQVISDDMQGGYYRLDYSSRQWLADVGIDEVRSVSGGGPSTTFITGDARYQMSRDWGIGSISNISRSNGNTNWSLGSYVDQVNAWGTGRAQADLAEVEAGRDMTLAVSQAWSTPAGMRLSTSTSIERISGAIINGNVEDSTILGVAAFGGGQFTTRLSVEGNVNWATAVQGRAAPAVSANVSLIYRVSQNWEILATYYDSQTGSFTPLTVYSPLAPPVATAAVPAFKEQGVFLTLRYKRAAGSPFAPLGGAHGSGSGEIAGVVFLDANNNGQLDAGEAGAPNVTVVLDGRYSVRTDASGRFTFPVVGTGHHVITVVSDNLPLPWALINEGRTELDVSTRDRTHISIAAQRPR
jgi:hypothetical protein